MCEDRFDRRQLAQVQPPICQVPAAWLLLRSQDLILDLIVNQLKKIVAGIATGLIAHMSICRLVKWHHHVAGVHLRIALSSGQLSFICSPVAVAAISS